MHIRGFALQDGKVVAAIEPKLLEAESIRSQHRSPDDLGAWDLVIQAKPKATIRSRPRG